DACARSVEEPGAGEADPRRATGDGDASGQSERDTLIELCGIGHEAFVPLAGASSAFASASSSSNLSRSSESPAYTAGFFALRYAPKMMPPTMATTRIHGRMTTYGSSEPATSGNCTIAMVLNTARAMKPSPGAMKVLHQRVSPLRR